MLTFRVPLVLASASPRRQELLRRLGLAFDLLPFAGEEALQVDLGPGPAVEVLAREKAAPASAARPDALVLAADTVVVLDGDVLGKPSDADGAAAMLHRLSGRTHTVYTGIALVHPPSDRAVTAHEATEVTFAELSGAEVQAYVATGSPLDKAGAYGIQDDLGALFVAGIRGDYYNVVGLPLHLLYRTLKASFPDLISPPGGARA